MVTTKYDYADRINSGESVHVPERDLGDVLAACHHVYHLIEHDNEIGDFWVHPVIWMYGAADNDNTN